MGVPGFFVWLMKHNVHNNIILNKLDNIDNLYFDANCLFHPKCFDILKLHPSITDTYKLEELMIKRIIKYIKYIIDYVNPKNKIFIAVDGVAPIAKINQQRKRRYKSVIDKEYNEYLNNKYKMNKNTSWSNIVITPGTNFMIRLDKELEKLKNLSNNKIIYSSYKEEGEGEHKIIKYIKKNSDNKYKNVIYGLDADLIFLSMSAHSQYNQIYLLRESQHLNNDKNEITEDINDKLCYLSIEKVIDTYYEYIINKLNNNNKLLNNKIINKYNLSKDFIILCFMLGNDFIPNLPSINIRVDGIEYLIEAYCKMFENYNEYIYDNKINWDSYKIILKYLSETEDYYFKKVLPQYKYRIKNRKCNHVDDYNIELWEHDNLKNINIIDNIKLGCGDIDEYKFRYYEYNYNSRINQKKIINNACENYINMIQWITKYYFDIETPSWQYCYYFNEAPFASDLMNYLDNNDIQFNINYKEPIDMKTQLLSVIPSYYSDILKECKVDINKFKLKITKYMFPKEYEIEYNKEQYWMCEVKLPMIDIELLK